MKRAVLIFLGIMIPWVLIFAQEDYEPGVVLLQVQEPDIVKLDENKVINGSSHFQEILDQYSVIKTRDLSFSLTFKDGWYRVEFPKEAPLKEIREALSACPDIRKVSLNGRGSFFDTPDDTRWPQQWNLHKILMEYAWDITKPNSTILVGVLDSGIDYNHEDLTENVWQNLDEDDDGDGHTLEFNGGQWILDPGDINGTDSDGNGYVDDLIGYDFTFYDNDPMDDYIYETTYHGTRVSGVIAGRTYNGKGVAGIAGGWNNQSGVKLIPLRISDPTYGSGWLQDRATLAIDYLRNLRNQGHTVIVNMSFGAAYLSDAGYEDFRDAVYDARDEGIILIAAAGNKSSSYDPPYNQPEVVWLPLPARWEGVLAIGAAEDGSTLQDEHRSSYSFYDYETPKLLIVAPVDNCVTSGDEIHTTYPNNSYINWFNGTSSACPQAVGTACLILTINPSLSYSNISNILAGTAEHIGTYEYDPSYPPFGRALEVGYGRLNTYSALLMTLAYDNKTPNIAPTIYNNQRILARGINNTNYLYEVFFAGIAGTNKKMELFFRRSTNNGSSWDETERLTLGEEINKYLFPCISITDEGSDDGVHVIWQKLKDNGKYQVYYRKSTDGGDSWEDQVLLGDEISCHTSNQKRGPQPVITWISYGSGYKLLTVWVTSGGIKYKTWYNDQWSSAGTLYEVPYNSYVWYPSLMGKGTWASLTYDTRYYGVYSRVYNGSSWTIRNLVSPSPFNYDRYSQIAINPSKKHWQPGTHIQVVNGEFVTEKVTATIPGQVNTKNSDFQALMKSPLQFLTQPMDALLYFIPMRTSVFEC